MCHGHGVFGDPSFSSSTSTTFLQHRYWGRRPGASCTRIQKDSSSMHSSSYSAYRWQHFSWHIAVCQQILKATVPAARLSGSKDQYTISITQRGTSSLDSVRFLKI